MADDSLCGDDDLCALLREAAGGKSLRRRTEFSGGIDQSMFGGDSSLRLAAAFGLEIGGDQDSRSAARGADFSVTRGGRASNSIGEFSSQFTDE